MASEIVKDAESIMAECTTRVRRSTRTGQMLPYGVAQLSLLALHIVRHFKKKGVTVTKRSPFNLNRLIVEMKKIGRKSDPPGQGRLEQLINKTIMLPDQMARILGLFLQMINLYNKNGWNQGRKMVGPMDQLLNELCEIRRKSQRTRVQG